jgi:hypothetical protein
MGTIFWTETSVINYHHSLRDNTEEHSSLATLHCFCLVAHPTYAVQFYLTTTQHLANSAVMKHIITQFFRTSVTFSLLVPDIFYNTPIIKHLQKLLFPSV